MKIKLILAIGLLALLLLPAGLALADNGPHGGYTATTDACAGCHRAHTAGAARLLFDDVPNLCFSCHGNAGTGADTNVEDGIYLERDGVAEAPVEGVVDRGLKAGGFVNALMDTDWNGAAGGTPTTSSHLNDGSTGTAWGNGAIGSGPGAAGFSLSCISCHDPHGGADSGVPTYRLLRTRPLGSGAASDVAVTDELNKLYTLSDTCEKSGNQYFGEGYIIAACDINGETWSGMDLPETEISNWCAQCHTRYLHAPTGGPSTAGSQSSGDPIFNYRHRTNDTPVVCGDACHNDPVGRPFSINTWGGPMWKHRVACMTCHVAHGSTASMGGFADPAFDPPGPVDPIFAGDSALLRVDNRGTCQLCHGK
jgi:predicted CXXCH cytochrome family protein